MSKEIDQTKFSVYHFKTDDSLYVAVPKVFLKVIDEAKKEFGKFSSVPNDKTVRGVFVQRHGKNYHYIDNNEQQNDITINQLQE
jgi:hypothetical protein